MAGCFWITPDSHPCDWIRYAVFGSSIPAGMTQVVLFLSQMGVDALEIAIRPDTSGTFDSSSEPYAIKMNAGNGLYYLKKIGIVKHVEFWIFIHLKYKDKNSKTYRKLPMPNPARRVTRDS